MTINIIILSILICFSMTACGKKNKNQQSNQSSEQSEKIPSQLTGIEENVEKLIKTLGGPASKTNESQGGESQGSQSQGGQSQGGQSQGSQGQGGQSQGGQSQGGQSQGGQSSGGSQKKDIWSQTLPIITKLHYQWNDLSTIAAKKGANKQLIDKFSDALNNVSIANESKDQKKVLIAASNLYGILPDFYSLYKSKEVSPELKRVKHHIRNAIISSMNDDWAQADSDINTLQSSWTISKSTLPKEQQDLVNKLDYSIYEFQKVEKEKNKQLTELKGKVAMSNIDNIEKAMKSSGGSS